MRLACILCTLIAAAVLLAGTLAPPEASAQRKLADYAVGDYPIGGDFTLTNHDGGQTSLAEFRGQAVLLAFGYTNCPDVCPTTLADFKRVKQALGGQGQRLQALFISVDPERDTPAHLKAYVGHFDPSFIGLTGSADALQATTQKYMAKYRLRDRGSAAGYQVDHTAFIYLIGPQGKVRYLFTPDANAELMAAGVRAVLGGAS